MPIILAANRMFEIQHVVNCPGEEDLPLKVYGVVNNTVMVPNRVFLSGYMEAREKVSGPIDLSSEDIRCDLKSQNCEKYFSLKVTFILILIFFILLFFRFQEYAEL